jgi:hypothetical protein
MLDVVMLDVIMLSVVAPRWSGAIQGPFFFKLILLSNAQDFTK